MTSPDTQRVRCCGGASPAAAVEMANATAKARQPEMALMRSNQPAFAAKVPHAERLTFAARARSRARAVLRTSSRRPFSSPHSIRAAGLPSGRVSIRDPTKFVTFDRGRVRRAINRHARAGLRCTSGGSLLCAPGTRDRILDPVRSGSARRRAGPACTHRPLTPRCKCKSKSVRLCAPADRWPLQHRAQRRSCNTRCQNANLTDRSAMVRRGHEATGLSPSPNLGAG